MIDQEKIEKLVNSTMSCSFQKDDIEFDNPKKFEEFKSSMLRLLLPKDLFQILEDITYWDTCPHIYKEFIEEFLTTLPKEDK